jgi:hypothetical protein
VLVHAELPDQWTRGRPPPNLRQGERANELLAAVAGALGRKHVAPYEDGVVYLMVDDVARDRELIEDALDGAGDDGRYVVRLRG